MTRGRARGALVAAAIAGASIVGAARHAEAQTHWWAPAAIGYGGAGFGAGVAVLFIGDVDLASPLLVLPLLGAGAGSIAGLATGKSADRRLARGEELTGGHRNALRAGTVLSGAALGALVSFILINPEGTGGSDEAIFATSVGAGTLLGILVQSRLEPALHPRTRVGVRARPDEVGVAVRATW